MTDKQRTPALFHRRDLIQYKGGLKDGVGPGVGRASWALRRQLSVFQFALCCSWASGIDSAIGYERGDSIHLPEDSDCVVAMVVGGVA